jgi:hypothetical protein
MKPDIGRKNRKKSGIGFRHGMLMMSGDWERTIFMLIL